MKKPKYESATTPGFVFAKPQEVNDAFDVENFLNYWYTKQEKGMDIRHFVVFRSNDSYATILFEKDIILDPEDVPPEKIGRFERHISTNSDGLLEINYYD